MNFGNIDRSFVFNQINKVETETLSDSGSAVSYQLGYDYNSKGDLEQLHYPTGTSVDFDPDAFGRPRAVGDFVEDVDYHPSGFYSAIDFANGVTTTTTIHPRQWISGIHTVGSATAVNLQYGYDTEGNTTSVSDSLATTYNSILRYDQLNRLNRVRFPYDDNTQHYLGYDPSGNLVHKSTPRMAIDYTYVAVTNLLDSVSILEDGQSQVRFYDHDNSYRSVTSNGDFDFGYDGANNLTSASGSGAAITHTYDGEGTKVITETNGDRRYFFYSADKLLFEVADQGGWFKEYFYLDNNLVAGRKVTTQ